MRLSIRLSEDAILVVKGNAGSRLCIRDCHCYELPKGTLINDVITDEDALATVLREIKKQYPAYAFRIHLIFGSNRVIAKMMSVPNLNRKQLLYLVEKELGNYLVEEKEMVYDYSVVHKNQTYGGMILGAAVEKQKIDAYKELFHRCGMKITSVDIGLNALVQLAEHHHDLCGKTYILAALDGRNMQTSLYINGIYRHTGRSRFLYERGTGELIKEVVKDIGAINGFAVSLEEGVQVTRVYFCGVREDEETLLFQALREEMGVECRLLENPHQLAIRRGSAYRLADYAYATGSMFGTKKVLNFIKVEQRGLQHMSLRYRMIVLLLLFPLLCAICGLQVTLYAVDRTAQLEQEVYDTEQYLAGEKVRRGRAEWEVLLQKQERLWSYEAAEKDIREQMASKPLLTAGFINELEAVMGGTAEILWEENDPIHYEEGVLTFSARTDGALEASACVSRLEESGIYERVVYEGFEEVEEAETGARYYRFRVVCHGGGAS